MRSLARSSDGRLSAQSAGERGRRGGARSRGAPEPSVEPPLAGFGEGAAPTRIPPRRAQDRDAPKRVVRSVFQPRRDPGGAVETGELERVRVSLERRIRAHLGRGALEVTLTDNRYTMISVRRERRGGRRYSVRLHHMFADADPAITRALARYIAKNDPTASRLLGDYIDANQHRVRSRSRRRPDVVIETSGQFFDLASIYDHLNRRYFGGRIDARITWGQRRGTPRRRNSIKMGSYSVEDRLIRIHRSLDRAFVPRFFVEWIVYHEMLHQVHDVPVVNGRRRFHTKAFLRDEAGFEHYRLARAWERAHLDDLLTY